MAVFDDVPTMPFERLRKFELAPLYAVLQEQSPVSRVRSPAGDPAWLVLGAENVRAMLAHPGLGRAHPDPQRAARFSNAAIMVPMGDVETERADHSRMRIVMNRGLTARRVELMRLGVQALVDELLDDLGRRTPPADLHEVLSSPLPALVICELLGVPYEDRTEFRSWTEQSMDMSLDPAATMAAQQRLWTYMRGLVERKGERPGDDVISELIDARDVEGRISAEELVQFAAGLLFAGHETTGTMIDLGVLLLLTHPAQWALLRAEPALLPGAVEEILRCRTNSTGVVVRYTSRDVEVAGVTIPAGDLVLLGILAANRDERVFPGADRFDITRDHNPHLAFGHGRYVCVGSALARLQLQCVFGTLVQRFPQLRLAVPLEEIRERSNVITGGVEGLPVVW